MFKGKYTKHRIYATCKCSDCGKAFKVQATRCISKADIGVWESWAKENYTICPKCMNRQIEEAQIPDTGYPDLTGTEKEVKWANLIRYNMTKIFRSGQQLSSGGKQFFEALMTKTDARWWISRRDNDINVMYTKFLWHGYKSLDDEKENDDE